MKRRIALLGVVALVMSMFGALPSRAADLVLTFPTAGADFYANNWNSVAVVTGVTPGVSGGSGGDVRATVSAGTNGFLRLQNTTGITAAYTFDPVAFDADSEPGLATISFQGSVANVNLALRSLEFKRTGTGTNTLTASVIDGTGAVFDGRYYEVIPDVTTWAAAMSAALKKTTPAVK